MGVGNADWVEWRYVREWYAKCDQPFEVSNFDWYSNDIPATYIQTKPWSVSKSPKTIYLLGFFLLSLRHRFEGRGIAVQSEIIGWALTVGAATASEVVVRGCSWFLDVAARRFRDERRRNRRHRHRRGRGRGRGRRGGDQRHSRSVRRHLPQLDHGPNELNT